MAAVIDLGPRFVAGYCRD